MAYAAKSTILSTLQMLSQRTSHLRSSASGFSLSHYLTISHTIPVSDLLTQDLLRSQVLSSQRMMRQKRRGRQSFHAFRHFLLSSLCTISRPSQAKFFHPRHGHITLARLMMKLPFGRIEVSGFEFGSDLKSSETCPQ